MYACTMPSSRGLAPGSGMANATLRGSCIARVRHGVRPKSIHAATGRPETPHAASGDHVTIADLGEFGLIATLSAGLPRGERTVVGIGDDAAVLTTPDGRVVATTDLLLEGRHFRRDWSPPADIGGKAAAQNLVDVAAMGAVPVALLRSEERRVG